MARKTDLSISQWPMPRHVPDRAALERMAVRFPQLEIETAETYLALLTASTELHRALSKHYAAHGLPSGRFVVMVSLLNAPNQTATPSELADQLGVTRSTMTGLLDSLEREGLLERLPVSPDDRRCRAVRLTPAGVRKMEAVMPDHLQRVSALMKPLKPSERKTLARLLATIMKGLEALNHANE
ncbi:MAG: MarR family transcriptional regulator [Candidatus Sumerlaeaceae bacterium]|nr:MarR family transcriptional regulator [Candidatus Sumerlaeaceae bacterium]